jgi:hypothetical protein
MPGSVSKPAPTFNPSDPIVARASNEYRLKRLAIVVMLVGCGGWFGYDGMIKWPKENDRIKELDNDIKVARNTGDDAKAGHLTTEKGKLTHHSDTDLQWQKVLAMILPPLGLIVFGWSFYQCRGEYRLRDKILTVPGHPSISLDAIRSIDKTDWDRKGIALIEYELPNGARGSAKLDDFIYQRPPTDEIFKRIEEYTGTGEPSTEPAET